MTGKKLRNISTKKLVVYLIIILLIIKALITVINISSLSKIRSQLDYVEINELKTNPRKYHDLTITTCGEYESGFEISRLSESIDIRGASLIWPPLIKPISKLTGSISTLLDFNRARERCFHGKFETRDQKSEYGFGHLGSYEHRLLRPE